MFEEQVVGTNKETFRIMLYDQIQVRSKRGLITNSPGKPIQAIGSPPVILLCQMYPDLFGLADVHVFRCRQVKLVEVLVIGLFCHEPAPVTLRIQVV